MAKKVKKTIQKKSVRTKKASSRAVKNSLERKFIFVTGGVVSSIGKGLAAASLATLLEARGVNVTMMKCDPYINVDPGTMSPLQHGEVYVTEDGAETDLDLGHYERFTSAHLSRANSVSAGQVYESVIAKERRGDYLGGTVQIIPHITNEIKRCICKASEGFEVIIVEIGGTVGDIEGLPFLEAIRQMRVDVGIENSLLIHVTYVPYIAAAGELKSKPTQHSVKELQKIGLIPDFLVCRTEKKISKDIRNKIGLFCNVKVENVIEAVDATTIYDVPLMMHDQGLDIKVTNRLNLKVNKPSLAAWKKMVNTIKSPKNSLTIGIIGKYVGLKESYKSLHESLVHGSIANEVEINIVYIDSEKINKSNVSRALKGLHGVLVPGGFGERGIEGKMIAIGYAREKEIPFFGICLGMQLAAIEFARNVCGFKKANSREFSKTLKGEKSFVIDFMEEQKSVKDKGGTMRLGAYPCHISGKTRLSSIYKNKVIHERHRHRFEFNNDYKDIFAKNGMLASGICRERNLVEVLEVSKHPWFVGVQFHPEFKSRPTQPHPLFTSFVKASLAKKRGRL